MFKVLRKNQVRREKEQTLVRVSPEARLKIALCYPNHYSVGMANLGFQRVYQLWNQIPSIACERAFYPDPEDEAEYLEKQIPICSLESGRPISEFDVVAFSFSFETDYLRALKMLRLSRIPLRTSERKKGSGKKNFYPLIIAGGIAISANPAPMADFLDLIVVGEAEPVIESLTEHLMEIGKNPAISELEELFSELRNVYLPSIEERETRIQQRKIYRASALEKDLPASQVVFSEEMEFSDLGLIELMRGCKRGCRFCLEGYFARPPREANYQEVIKAVEKIRAYRRKLGLIAPVVSDWKGLDALLEFLSREKIPFSVSSLRITALNERLLELLKRSKNQTLTFAPEAGSSRLKRFLNKEPDEEKILRAMKIVGAYQFPRIKLYYQIGFPGETELEVEEIASSVRRIKTALAMGAGKRNYPGIIEISVNAFVPKAWTAFQWLRMAGQEELERKFARLRNSLKRQEGFEVKTESARSAVWQGMLSRGDRKLGEILEALAKDQIRLPGILNSEEIVNNYLRERAEGEEFPWDLIEPGVSKDYLWEEYKRGRRGKLSPACQPGCRICGAC